MMENKRAAAVVAVTAAAVLLLAGCSTDEGGGHQSYKAGSQEAMDYAWGYNAWTEQWLDATPEEQKATCNKHDGASKPEDIWDEESGDWDEDKPKAEGVLNAIQNWCGQLSGPAS